MRLSYHLSTRTARISNGSSIGVALVRNDKRPKTAPLKTITQTKYSHGKMLAERQKRRKRVVNKVLRRNSKAFEGELKNQCGEHRAKQSVP